MPWARPFDVPQAERLLPVHVFRDTQEGFLAGDGLTAAAHQERGARHFFAESFSRFL
ncbi:MAG: hypothetical protein ACUVSA_05660 [Desulfosoma sp.]